MNTMENDDVMEIERELEEQANQGEVAADTLRILEALLFASDELLPAARIKAILPDNPDARQIRKMVDKINVQLQKERHPFEIVEIGGGYQFRTVAYFHPWVRQIFKEKAAKKLSMQALECLAVIAYKQPVSKAEIEAVRGVVSDGAMKTLLEKKLVTISGRSDKPGKPLQYSTTHEFLRYFGLNKIEDLPRIEEFEAIAREKIEDLSFEELTGENTDAAIDDPENLQIESEPQETQSVSSDSPEPTAVFEINNTQEMTDAEKSVNEDTQDSDQPGSQSTISDSEMNEISERGENVETQPALSPEPTSVFEIHDLSGTEDTEEAQKKDTLNEDPMESPKDEVEKDSEIITGQDLPGQTVENNSTPTPEPTAVFEIHGFFDELEKEASAEEKTEQNNNTSSNSPVGASETSQKKTGEKTVDTFPAQDMVEFETAEITVDHNEESEAVVDKADKSVAATRSAVEKKSAEKTIKPVQEEEETLEVFIPQKSVSQESEESAQQKKSFFSKIRKKKKEEPEE